MAIRLAIVGLDGIQQDWLEAVGRLRASGEVELVGVGHRTQAAARDLADRVGAAAYDDLRKLLRETQPQVLLIDRPENATIEFLTVCVEQNIGLLSLGPVVHDYQEAATLAASLQPQTHLLYQWPRFADSFAYKHCADADEYLRPIRFVSMTWLGMNHALAKTSGRHELAVRSLSALAWDAVSTLAGLIDVPSSVYATIRGTVAGGGDFADITGSASLTLRFSDDATASVTLSDRVAARRELLLIGQAGSLRLDGERYSFCDADGKVIDEGVSNRESGVEQATATLRRFVEQYEAKPSPARGWAHRLGEIASVMEAMVVSHRTDAAESPERFRLLRR